MVTSFADGSKISFEQAIVANATGFVVKSRGMSRGLEYRDDVMTIGKLYDIDELRELGGIVDYVVGTPLTKVYCLAEHPDPKQQHYLSLYKMGEGPLYSFFIPYHLVHFEVPNAIARAVLFRDSVAKPIGGPVVEVCAVAKRDLKAGETLDDYGIYMTYGEAVNADEMAQDAICLKVSSKGASCCGDIAKDAGPHLRRRGAAPIVWRISCVPSNTRSSEERPGCRIGWPFQLSPGRSAGKSTPLACV